MSARRLEPRDRMGELGDFYAANAAKLHTTLARHFGGNTQLAEEVLQTAFAKLAAREDIAPADAGGWLFTVARNEGYHLTGLAGRVDSLDHEIVLPSGQTVPLVDTVPGPDDTPTAVERRERLDAVAQLKLAERAVLGQYAAGFSYAEIAQLTGYSHTKVNRSIREGRAALHAREASIEAPTEQHMQDGHALELTPSQPELQQTWQRIAQRRDRAETDLAIDIGR